MIARVRRLGSIGPSGLALVCGAFVTVVRVRVALWVLPWNRFPAPVARSFAVPPTRPGVDRLEWAVRSASRFVPRATCLAQAVALHRLLSRYGYRSNVQIGVRSDGGRFDAHAWVEHEAKSLLSNSGQVREYVRFFSWPPSQPDLS